MSGMFGVRLAVGGSGVEGAWLQADSTGSIGGSGVKGAWLQADSTGSIGGSGVEGAWLQGGSKMAESPPLQRPTPIAHSKPSPWSTPMPPAH